MIGADFPVIGGDFPVIGAGFPVIGADLPVIGVDFPVIGVDFPVIGAGFPVIGVGFAVIGAGFAVIHRGGSAPPGGYHTPLSPPTGIAETPAAAFPVAGSPVEKDIGSGASPTGSPPQEGVWGEVAGGNCGIPALLLGKTTTRSTRPFPPFQVGASGG